MIVGRKRVVASCFPDSKPDATGTGDDADTCLRAAGSMSPSDRKPRI
jgi:hypothetical protein